MSIKNKRIFITGATSGIGKATAETLAKRGAKITVLARNEGKARLLLDDLKELAGHDEMDFIQCDLSSLKSVDTAIHITKTRHQQIDVLINNAGGIFQKRQESADRYELTLAMNHLGPFHLTNGLMSLLKKGLEARIINVSSEAHRQAKIDLNDFNMERSWSSIGSYGNAKLYNIYSAKYWSLQLLDKKVTANSLHPGVVNTGFASNFSGFWKGLLNIMQPFMLSPQKGAETSVYLAESDEVVGESGEYWKKKKTASPSKLAQSSSMREEVIEKSFELIRDKLGKELAY